MEYYHITELKNLSSILQNGLQSNEDGEIFVFENKSITINNVTNSIADCIAENQIFLKEYIMFEINDKGFNSDLINDSVSEISHKQQWYVKQSVIDKKHVKFVGGFDNNFKSWFELF